MRVDRLKEALLFFDFNLDCRDAIGESAFPCWTGDQKNGLSSGADTVHISKQMTLKPKKDCLLR